MISNWLQRADPGFYWVVTYILSWIFLILWSPLMILLAIPFLWSGEIPRVFATNKGKLCLASTTME